MAEIKVAEHTETTPAKQTEYRYRVTPRHGLYFENGKWILEVALPGVNKDKVTLKVLDDSILLRAGRDQILYTLDLEFDFKVEKEKVTASYKEGLLKVEMVPFNPIDHAYTVKID